MVVRLSEIRELGCIKALVVFLNSLNGFIELLHYSKQSFSVSDKMIALNETNQVRIWGNENYALNFINK